ncbi:MAG: hypothetical protein JJ992_02575, partial [Planctomycetes bacterium]|nr:hypothetical protein [Planctomycetota bacterium]
MEWEMNKIICSLILLLAGTVTGVAFAAPSVTVGDSSGPEGSGTPVQVPVSFQADGTVVGGQFDITFDDTNLSVDLTNCGGDVWSCNLFGAGVIRIAGVNQQLNPVPSSDLGTLDFDISGASAGIYNLTVTNELYSDSGGGTVAPSGTDSGTLTVEGPAYSSNPAPGSLVLGPVIQGDTDPTANVDISNTGAAGTTLTGTCTEISDPDSVFSLSGDTSFSVLQGDPADTVTVTCDSAGTIATHIGTMECTHDGDSSGESSPAVYGLSCTITAGPQPAYSSNPAPGATIDLGPTEQADPDPTAIVSITNSGDTGTTLTGTCGVTGDPQISVSDGAFSVVQGGAADIQTVSCDASAQGLYSATLSCEHNGSNASPATYTVNCEITPPGAAIFRSDPVPGAIDMTPGDDPAAGSPDPMSPLTFFNDAEVGDNDLTIACTLSGDAEISVDADLSGGIAIGPGNSSGVTFTCDATNVGNYTATYSCGYDTDAVVGDDGSAQYNLACDVREPEADVNPSPANGTELTGLANPGETFDYNVTFTEVNDEGIDGEVTTCSLADGTNFAITS